jgi:hypothetical protein
MAESDRGWALFEMMSHLSFRGMERRSGEERERERGFSREKGESAYASTDQGLDAVYCGCAVAWHGSF